MPYTYVLKCNDGTYCTGSSWDLSKRLAEHNAGQGGAYTAKRLPVKLVYFEEFDRIEDAFYREKEIQNLDDNGIRTLVKENYETLKESAREIFGAGFFF